MSNWHREHEARQELVDRMKRAELAAECARTTIGRLEEENERLREGLKCSENAIQHQIRCKNDPVSAWIPVEERLPKTHVPILVWNGITHRIAIYSERHALWFNSSRRDEPWRDVTHWQPLPEPPEVNDD